jgi:UDPglucose 6-dehydrogenase
VQLLEKVRSLVGDLRGKVVGLLGLTFKPNTDDLREAPALDVAQRLLAHGAVVRAYDPVGMPRAKELLPALEMAESPYALAEGADVLVVCTEWNEFKQLDLARLRQLVRGPGVVDGRNIYDPKVMARHGFHYLGFGQGYGADGEPLAMAEAEKQVRA